MVAVKKTAVAAKGKPYMHGKMEEAKETKGMSAKAKAAHMKKAEKKEGEMMPMAFKKGGKVSKGKC